MAWIAVQALLNSYVYKTAKYHLKSIVIMYQCYSRQRLLTCRESTSLFLDTYADTSGNIYNSAADLT